MTICRIKSGRQETAYIQYFVREGDSILKVLWLEPLASPGGKESFKKQLLSLPRICGEGDGWHCSYFKNCRKRRGAIARQREGRRWLGERASQEEFMKGVENAGCVCCLQDLSADTVSLWADCRRRVPAECMWVCVLLISDHGSVWTADGKRRECIVWKDFAVTVLVCGWVVCVTDFFCQMRCSNSSSESLVKSGWLS